MMRHEPAQNHQDARISQIFGLHQEEVFQQQAL